jgi:MoxR-like ATPase
MKVFGRWKKAESEICTPNNKPIHTEIRQGLFDDIYGFQDVKDLFEMAMHAERPVHPLLCGPPASAKSLFIRSVTKLERS